MQTLIRFTILLVFIASAVVLYHFLAPIESSPAVQVPLTNEPTIDLDSTRVPNITVGGTVLSPNATATIYTSDLTPSIQVQEFPITSLSIDGSLNVLNDNFYGETSSSSEGVLFEPNFSIAPGSHRLTIDIRGKVVTYDFIIAYHESFSEPFQNLSWVVPAGSDPEWFSIENGKLHAMPASDLKGSSRVFVYKLTGTYVVDFEMLPLGSNVSVVPYVINSVRDEFVLGSNGNNRQVLFHTRGTDREQIEGSQYELNPNQRYHVRIERVDDVVRLYIRPLDASELVNPMDETSHFAQLIEYADKGSHANVPAYQFGIGLWQNSDGVLIDDVYITSI